VSEVPIQDLAKVLAVRIREAADNRIRNIIWSSIGKEIHDLVSNGLNAIMSQIRIDVDPITFAVKVTMPEQQSGT